MDKKIFVYKDLPKEGLEELFKKYEVDYHSYEKTPPRDLIFEKLADVEGMLCFGLKIDAELLSHAPKLKVVSNYGAGYDRVDVSEATRRGIVVTNTPGAVTEATAEMAFGLIVSAARRICEYDRLLRNNGRWDWGMSGMELTGKTLGIIGFGRIGQAVAKRAKAFGMEVIYYQRTPRGETADEKDGCFYLPMEQLFERSDVISVHVPLSAETYHLIGEREFTSMKKGCFFINTARGPVVDENALVRALESGHLGGAGLDVFEKEPKIHEGLLRLDNTVLTPHAGTHTYQTKVKMTREAARNLMAALEGFRPESVVNPEVYDFDKNE